jgi:alkyl hydroperoxide reductase subunit AhpC
LFCESGSKDLKLREFLGANLGFSLKLHKYLGAKWGVVVTIPDPFDPVSATGFAMALKAIDEFTKRNVKLVVVSGHAVSHEWFKDVHEINKTPGSDFPFPIVTDPQGEIAAGLGVLDKSVVDDKVSLWFWVG